MPILVEGCPAAGARLQELPMPEAPREIVMREIPLRWTAAAAGVFFSVVIFIVSLSARAGALEQRVAAMEARNEKMESRQELMMAQFDVIDTKLGRIEGSIESVKDQRLWEK